MDLFKQASVFEKAAKTNAQEGQRPLDKFSRNFEPRLGQRDEETAPSDAPWPTRMEPRLERGRAADVQPSRISDEVLGAGDWLCARALPDRGIPPPPDETRVAWRSPMGNAPPIPRIRQSPLPGYATAANTTRTEELLDRAAKETQQLALAQPAGFRK